jgi:chromosome segregation protein
VYFKSLELSGFKSFADKTRFDFEPGVTAIVGPNGCGKSNVADAIRWVMGEQNARLLRGLKMEDVIFNGTDQRKPIGLAEVSLTLSGVGERLKVDYDEITVTRRVLRSGGLFLRRRPASPDTRRRKRRPCASWNRRRKTFCGLATSSGR